MIEITTTGHLPSRYRLGRCLAPDLAWVWTINPLMSICLSMARPVIST
jgi:hypothetical protein